MASKEYSPCGRCDFLGHCKDCVIEIQKTRFQRAEAERDQLREENKILKKHLKKRLFKGAE